ncbi:malate permease [Roseiconus nitratireducens]|uniref:Malate permease n=1 Tax=Roseiconus nitratireducens TaxID=2605748 RepID=A0A5M6CY97_9BACT|nr:AEC family transporter [Roseiconus nitratireducens]KAA5540197.1 malate permease [Roseiconus nitratireducens]
MQDLWPIIASVLGVFLVMGIGAACRHLGWLTAEADRTLANLTANVMLPAYFIHQFSRSEEIESIATAWQPPVFGFVATAVGFGVALLFARTCGPWLGLTTDASQRAFALCAGICNYGYIPLPLAEEFYPSAVIELILHNVGVDVALWSIGIAIIGGTAGSGWKKPLTSPPLWAVIISITLSQLSLVRYIPDPVLSAIGALGGCAIPLGLLLSGAIIVDFLRDRSWLGAPRVALAAILIRQGLLPLLMLAAGAMLVTQNDLRTVVMLQAAMPAAVFPIVLTKLYHRDTETALRVVLWTSIAALVLIPIWLAIGAAWLG